MEGFGYFIFMTVWALIMLLAAGGIPPRKDDR